MRFRSAEDAGNTLSSAPESMRKWRLEKTSKMEMEDGEEEEEKGLPAAAISDRAFRFPPQGASGRGGAWDIEVTCTRTPLVHSAGERNTKRRHLVHVEGEPVQRLKKCNQNILGAPYPPVELKAHWSLFPTP